MHRLRREGQAVGTLEESTHRLATGGARIGQLLFERAAATAAAVAAVAAAVVATAEQQQQQQ